MSNEQIITLCEGGTDEKTIDINHLVIPDLWHIAQRSKNDADRLAVEEVWSLAHDLKRHILK